MAKMGSNTINEDMHILAGIYLGILNEEQVKSLYLMMGKVMKQFIHGSMPLGQAFYYYYESFFKDTPRELFFVRSDVLAIPIFVIEVTKIFIKEKMVNGYSN
jgi:hypothetical protein